MICDCDLQYVCDSIAVLFKSLERTLYEPQPYATLHQAMQELKLGYLNKGIQELLCSRLVSSEWQVVRPAFQHQIEVGTAETHAVLHHHLCPESRTHGHAVSKKFAVV